MKPIAAICALCAAMILIASETASAGDRRAIIEKYKNELQTRITNSEDEEYRNLFAMNQWPVREYDAVKELSKGNRDLINLFIDYRQDLDRQKRPQIVEFIIPAWRAAREKEAVAMYVDAVMAEAEEVLKEEKPDLRKLGELDRKLDEVFALWGEKPDRIEKYLELHKEYDHREIMFSFQMAGLNSEKVVDYWNLRKEGFESKEIMESYRATGGEPMRFTRYWNLRKQGYDPSDVKRILAGRQPKHGPGQKTEPAKEPAKKEGGEKPGEALKPSEKGGDKKAEPEPKIKRMEWTGSGEAGADKGGDKGKPPAKAEDKKDEKPDGEKAAENEKDKKDEKAEEPVEEIKPEE
ncbi:MAG TPA: hypothetical protein PL033_09185 [Candidatus Brocadiia bacterium]|nr:hypothetical protein [Candidatus Brocadiia bacterium]